MEDRYKVHVGYIFFILVSIIVLLISVKWSEIKGLVGYITFALTLSSLILAVLAIIYSLVSNTSLTVVMHDVSRSANDISKASRAIQKSNKGLREAVSGIPDRMDSLDEGIAATREILGKMSGAKETTVKVTEGGAADTISEELVKRFMEQSSVRGVEVILAVILSHRQKTSFKLDELIEACPNFKRQRGYMEGYFIACASLNLYFYDTDAQGRWTITAVNEHVARNFDTFILAKTTRIAKEFAKEQEVDEEKTIAEWREDQLGVYKFFGVDPEV